MQRKYSLFRTWYLDEDADAITGTINFICRGNNSLIGHNLIIIKHFLIHWLKYQTRRIQLPNLCLLNPGGRKLARMTHLSTSQMSSPSHLPKIKGEKTQNSIKERVAWKILDASRGLFCLLNIAHCALQIQCSEKSLMGLVKNKTKQNKVSLEIPIPTQKIW